MNDNYLLGRMIAIFSYIIQGVSAWIIAVVIRYRNKAIVIAATVIWLIGLIALLQLKEEKHFKRRTFCVWNFMLSTALAVFYCFMFGTPDVLFMMIFIQWMVHILFLDKVLNVIMLLIDVVTVLGFTFIKVPEIYENFNAVRCIGGIIVLNLGCWVSFKLIDVIELQKRQELEQEESLDDFLELLEEKCEEANMANSAKSTFLANMSHEIRTPMNAILGFNTMIMRDSKDNRILTYANEIKQAGNNMLNLINDILDLSKIESGKMEIIPAEYEFGNFIHDIKNMIAVRAAAKELTLKLEIDGTIPAVLYGDDIRIRQILINLLNNAVKYTDSGSVTLKATGTRDGQDVNILFEVIDTGHGIKPEDMEKLVGKFERIELDKNRNVEGAGLGLNITVQLLSLMDSKLNVDSKYGEGSDFSFEIRQKIVDSSNVGDIEKRAATTEKKKDYRVSFIAPDARILVVDDNNVNRAIVSSLLNKTKIKIDEADSGFKCIEKAKVNKYDLILLDHMMPEMDGIETLHKLREMSDNSSKDAKVIVLTANAILGAKEQYIEDGFDDYLSKPIEPDKLESVVYKYLPKELVKTGEAAEEKKKEELDIPEIEGADWKYALIRLESVKLLKKSIELFHKSAQKELDALKSFFDKLEEDDNLNKFAVKVHSMKSSSATIGALAVSEIAKILEYAAKDNDIERVKMFMPVLEEKWKMLDNNIAGMYEEKAPEKYPFNPQALNLYFNAIIKKADEMDMAALDKISAQLDNMEYPDNVKPMIEELKNTIFNMEFDECAAIIARIKEII